jgi:hypothetical protein
MQTHWIFSLHRPLSASEAERLLKDLTSALSNWKAHGAPVEAEVELRFRQWLLVRAASGNASGCSVDWLQRTVSEVLADQELQIAPDATAWLYEPATDAVTPVPRATAIAAIRSGEWPAYQLVADQTVVHCQTFDAIVRPVSQSWLKTFVPQPVQLDA